MTTGSPGTFDAEVSTDGPARFDGYRYRTPQDSWRGEPPSAPTPSAVLLAVGAQFAQERRLTSRVWTDRDGRALLFRVGTRHVHIVGDSHAADELRAALSAGQAPGWQLIPMHETRTPLHVLRQNLSSRDYRLLAREGFTSVEELAATPDEGLLDLRNAGPTFLTAVRSAVANLSAPIDIAHLAAPDAALARRARINEQLRPEQQLRYRDFLAGMAASRLPDVAVDAVVKALNAEVLPPIDSTVALLLETADEPGLLHFYVQTHARSPDEPAAAGGGSPPS